MIVDSSAILAILLAEPEAFRFVQALQAAPTRMISAGTAVECGIVALRNNRSGGLPFLNRTLSTAAIEIVPTDHAQVRLAWEAFERFGKGRHPAGLNFGDCFAYALSRSTDLPLLFKGDDFSRTDVRVAPW